MAHNHESPSLFDLPEPEIPGHVSSTAPAERAYPQGRLDDETRISEAFADLGYAPKDTATSEPPVRSDWTTVVRRRRQKTIRETMYSDIGRDTVDSDPSRRPLTQTLADMQQAQPMPDNLREILDAQKEKRARQKLTEARGNSSIL